ncbi:MAG: helix-turn-helix domain-containing protein [Armatimonadetes bacterium]|nr:helix-turn-helix domain-containing protein [Armatimonadota bacterium]
MGRILTVEQAAEKLQVRPNTVREWLKKGRIPGWKFGRFYRISEDELQLILAGRLRQTLQPAEPKRKLKASDLLGKYARPGRTVDDFLREKHAEVEEEERRWDERHRKS